MCSLRGAPRALRRRLTGRASEHMKFTPKQRKIFIEEVVKEFKKKFPEEYQLIVKSCQQQRVLKRDKWGSDGAGWEEAWRWTLRLPARMFMILDMVLEEPRFLEDQKELEWFKKTFPEFLVCEKK